MQGVSHPDLQKEKGMAFYFTIKQAMIAER